MNGTRGFSGYTASVISVSYTHLEEISLSSLSSSDYRSLEELVRFLIEEFHGKGVNVSLPSLRIDAFSLDVMSKVQDLSLIHIYADPLQCLQR